MLSSLFALLSFTLHHPGTRIQNFQYFSVLSINEKLSLKGAQNAEYGIGVRQNFY